MRSPSIGDKVKWRCDDDFIFFVEQFLKLKVYILSKVAFYHSQKSFGNLPFLASLPEMAGSDEVFAHSSVNLEVS